MRCIWYGDVEFGYRAKGERVEETGKFSNGKKL